MTARISLAEQLAREGRLRPFVVQAPLALQAWARFDAPGEPLVVVVEGDGFSWVSPGQPSMDPTPRNPVGLRLAVADPSPNVLYLARPGQYLRDETPLRYWTSARFAPEVVDSVELAVRESLARARSDRLILAGYSGGATLAFLVAARLHRDYRVMGLVSVAGNLAVSSWAEARGLSPLTGSLDPVDQVEILADLPQRLMVGKQDRDVPPAVLEAYLVALPHRRCTDVVVEPVGHSGPWEGPWVRVRGTLPACK